jgi:hypothetical protein
VTAACRWYALAINREKAVTLMTRDRQICLRRLRNIPLESSRFFCVELRLSATVSPIARTGTRSTMVGWLPAGGNLY